MESELQITPEIHFAQLLASNQNRVRDRALKKLGTYLKTISVREGAFTEDSMLKLWKGIYYYFWNLDKPLIQEDKAGQISKFIHGFNRVQYSLMYFDTFFQTMSREWFALDKFRLEKFMMFARKFLRETFQLLKNSNWDLEMIKQFRKALKKNVANPDDRSCPLGLTTHISDIYMEELARVSSEESTPEVTRAFLIPYCSMLAYCNNLIILENVQKEIFLYLLDQDVDNESFEELSLLQFDHIGIAKLLKKWSNKEGIRNVNRKMLNLISKRFETYDPKEEVVGIPESEFKKRKAIRRKTVERAAQQLIEEERAFAEEKLAHKRKRKAQ